MAALKDDGICRQMMEDLLAAWKVDGSCQKVSQPYEMLKEI